MPKLNPLLFLFVGTCFLFGCEATSNIEEVSTSAKQQVEVSSEKEFEEEEITSSNLLESDSKFIEEGPLLEVGQYTIDDTYGKLELEKIASYTETVEVATGLYLTIKEVKIINFSDIPSASQEDALFGYGFEKNQGYDLQFIYEVQNDNEHRIGHTMVDTVVLSNGEQISRSIFHDETMDLEAQSKATDQVGHISIPTSDVSSVRFYVHPYNPSNSNAIDTKPVEIVFE